MADNRISIVIVTGDELGRQIVLIEAAGRLAMPGGESHGISYGGFAESGLRPDFRHLPDQLHEMGIDTSYEESILDHDTPMPPAVEALMREPEFPGMIVIRNREVDFDPTINLLPEPPKSKWEELREAPKSVRRGRGPKISVRHRAKG